MSLVDIGWVIITVVVFVVFVVFMLLMKRKKKQDDAWKQSSETRGFQILKTIQPVLTPNGHKVFFEKGTNPATFSLTACDTGVEQTFLKGECAGYPVDRPRHHVSIVVFNSIPDSNGDPAFKVFISPGNPYFGSQWDKEAGKGEEVDHYVLVAGQTIAVGDPYGDVIVIPHHTGNEAHLSTVCEYEMEHVILSYYDGEKFEATKTHNTGGHPLIPSCPGMALFTSHLFGGLCADALR